MKNKYEYLVRYSFRGGIGTFDCTMNKPIKSFKDIGYIKFHLEKTQEIENVVIESYILVRKIEGKRRFT